MVRRLVIGDMRVQQIDRKDGRRSWTILWPDGAVHLEAGRFLQGYEGSGTQRTYAYLLVDHLRWLERECLDVGVVDLRDLQRYMGILGADVRVPLGEPWRPGKRPYGQAALSTAAACVKGFYLQLASLGVNAELGAALSISRLPTRADRDRALLGHTTRGLPSNPLAPSRARRRHPKTLPENAKELLLGTVHNARDRLLVSWLGDGGFRIGEICGLHLADLHLREGASCGDCRAPHVHICDRETNPNRARAKTKHPWSVENGTVTGGLIRRASPRMIHTYFDYMTSQYPKQPGHGMLLVQLHGSQQGQPWTTVGARRMLGRAAIRAGLGRVRPHAFRHEFASAILDASGGNLLIARDAGGWASTSTVDEIYAHVDIHDPAFDAALRKVWGERA